MLSINITEELHLEQLQQSHGEDLFLLTDKNRAYLRQWLPWLDSVNNRDDTQKFIDTTIQQFNEDKGPQYAIIFQSELVGTVEVHPFQTVNKIAGLGYWLAEDKQGLGIMTLCCKNLIRQAFEQYDINRLQIYATELNTKSRAIPQRLGFTFEGVLRQHENLYNTFVDHALYSMLKSEYQSTKHS